MTVNVKRHCVLAAAVLCASAFVEPQAGGYAADKPFVSGGRIEMQLSGGSYEIRPGATARIQVAFGGNPGNAKAALGVTGTRADLKITDTPHNNFKATIDVPKAADLMIRLTGGDLLVGAITGNKDVESYGGDVTIAGIDPNEYASVDAAIKAGDIDAGVFGGSKSGLFQSFKWSGKGKYTLRAHLGAGDLRLTK